MRRCPDKSRSSPSLSIDRISRAACRARWILQAPGKAPTRWSRDLPEPAKSALAVREYRISIRARLAASSRKRSRRTMRSIRPISITRSIWSSTSRRLRIADADAPASLTAGIVRVGPFETRDARDDALLRASFDLRSLILEIRAAFTELQTPKYLERRPAGGQCCLEGSDRRARLAKSIPSSLSPAWRQQAIARETDRIAALESDIRERAFFNRRLKAGQFMRRRELELEAYAAEQARLKSEEDRRRVEAETLKADEDRRKAATPELPPTPAPSSNDAARSPTDASPPLPQPPPAPRPPSASQQPDPTATGLY